MIALPPDREWLTAAEAAAEALPGFAFDERHIRRFIVDHNVATRPRASGLGRKGREFNYKSLPAEAQAEYIRRYGRVSNALATDSTLSREAEKQLRAQARAAIVDAIEARLAEGGNVGTVLVTFAKLYKARKAGFDAIVYEHQPTATAEQVRVWRRKLKRDGLDGLVDGRGRPEGTGTIASDIALKNLIIAEIGARPHLAVASCKDSEEGGLQKIIERRLGVTVPVRTLQAYVKPLRPENNPLTKALAAPGKFKNSHKTAIGSYSQDVTRINQRWEMDATRGDVMCLVTGPDGRVSPRRCALTQVIDIYTRRSMIVVSDQPSSAASRATIRKAILAWGVPEVIKTDNGKEFKNFDVERMCREAGITLQYSRPFRPWEKPHVERMFGTILHCLFEKFPGYVGHSVADRIEIENKRSFQHRFGEDRRVLFEVELSPADLQARIDAWLTEFYERALHIELGTSPASMARVHAAEARLVGDPRMLDALMMNAKVCKVSKGLIRYKNRFYGSDQTGAIEVTPRFNERVQLRVDPLDPTWAAVYSPDGREFLCIAKDVELLDSSERQHMAVACSRGQDKVVSLFVRGIRKVGATHNIVDAMLTSEVPGITLTGPGAEGMIGAAAPQIAKHTAMLEARDNMDMPPKVVEPTREQRESAARMIEELEPKARAVRMLQCDGYERPAFDDDVDLIFWWEEFETEGGRLDQQDSADRKRLYADDDFCERLRIARSARASKPRKSDVA